MGMKKESLLLVPLLMLLLPMSFGESVMVSVRGLASIGKTEHTFICATIDWWPKAKCNYGQCPWGHTSLLNMDLTNPILPKAIEAFGTLKIRIGGSLEDQIYYKVGKFAKGCPNLKLSPKGLFGFSHGCLHMARWDKAYNLLHQSKAKITFGLNTLIRRKKLIENGLYGGDWDSSNARDFMKHILSKGQHIEAWELGNELSGSGVSARVDVKQYAKDVIALKGLVTELFQNSSSPGKVLAPRGFFDKEWYSQLLLLSGPNIIDGVTHHIYNLGLGCKTHAYYLDNAVQTFQDLQTTLKSFGPWSSAWVGEAGGAYNSGGRHVSHNFVNNFWYLDQLGMAAAFDTKVYCRQSLIGGNYGLLNTTTMVPNPDYYRALLWHRLMGSRALSTLNNGSPYLRSYSHCTKDGPGITLLFINLSNSTAVEISVVEDMNLYPSRVMSLEASSSSLSQGEREEYHLTPKDGDLESTTMLLNGVPLVLTETGDIPPLNPTLVDVASPVKMAPLSIAFVRLRDFKAPAC